jgi:hypothetical protein
MQSLSRFSSVVLIVLVVTFLAGALWIAYRVVVCGINEPSITAAALLATVAGLFLTAQRQMADRQEATSRFYLEQYQEGFDKACEILESATPGDALFRAKWIAAARVLATARGLYDRISVTAHRDVARMNIPHQSQRFMPFLEMSGAYYYGVELLPTLVEQSLDEAAKLSTKGSGTTVSTLRSIPERVLRTVWQAIAYPPSYKDVLGEQFTEGERLFLPTGLQAYLNHLDQWHSAAGQLHQRTSGERRE